MELGNLLNLLQETSQKIEVSPPFICGGVARSKYLNQLNNIDDLDVTNGDKTISYLAEEFYSALNKKFNITKKVMEDGHTSIFLGNIKLDFSSNFNVPHIVEILNKMKIVSPSDMKKEIFSRDFTCNALLLSLDLKSLYDPTNQGFKDLDKKIIKTCLSPSITLTSNRNRVVRSIYLATKLDFSIDSSIIDFVSSHPETINISTEKSTLDKLTTSFNKDPDKTNYYLSKMNLWNFIPINETLSPFYLKYRGK